MDTRSPRRSSRSLGSVAAWFSLLLGVLGCGAPPPPPPVTLPVAEEALYQAPPPTEQQIADEMWARYQIVDVESARIGDFTPDEARKYSRWLAGDHKYLPSLDDRGEMGTREEEADWSKIHLDSRKFANRRDSLFILGAGVRVRAAPPGFAGYGLLLGMLYTGDVVSQCKASNVGGELWLRIADSERDCDDGPERWISAGEDNFDYISYQPVPEEILAFMGKVAHDPSTRWSQRADAYFDGGGHPWPPPEVMESLRDLPPECIEEAGNELMGLLLGPAIVGGLVALDVPLGLAIGFGAVATGMVIYTINCVVHEREWQLDKALLSGAETFVATLGWFGKILSTAYGWMPCMVRLHERLQDRRGGEWGLGADDRRLACVTCRDGIPAPRPGGPP